MGQFRNTPEGRLDHLDNVDGDQGAFLFALPDVMIFQDSTTLTATDAPSSGAFNAQFESGKAYTLTVGVLGGGGGMTDGAALELALCFRDAALNLLTVAATTVTHSSALFPTHTRLTDFQVRIPVVRPTDPWAGKRIGIRVASITGSQQPGGYWALDNVRLTENLVPNGSFESPETDLASPQMDDWQKSPEPPWYVESSGLLWEQLTGQYPDSPYGATNHLASMEGKQAAWIFALPEVAIFQDLTLAGLTNPETSRPLDRTYEVGKSYALTVGVLGGGGGMANGATLRLRLYYRDAHSNRVTVAATTVTHSDPGFGAPRGFQDFQVTLPPVKPGDAWADRPLGIELTSTVGLDLFGGFWDVDNVRLTESLLANPSFENPPTDVATPAMDGWHKSPKPPWYDETGGFLWAALMRQFPNPPPPATNRMDNMDGRQAGRLFGLPEVAIFQDPLAGVRTEPPLGTTFAVGESYTLTVGVNGSGGGPPNAATLELSVYYRDSASNQVTVAATTISNTPTLFPPGKHQFTDFSVQVPTVTGNEPWVGRPLGVRIASTGTPDPTGGHWDVDHVRLRTVRDPVLAAPRLTGDQPQFTLQSAPGLYEIVGTDDLALPAGRWDRVAVITNVTGRVTVTAPSPDSGRRFYLVRPSP